MSPSLSFQGLIDIGPTCDPTPKEHSLANPTAQNVYKDFHTTKVLRIGDGKKFL